MAAVPSRSVALVGVAGLLLGAALKVEGVARGRLVAWSLGNFVFPANSPGTTSTGVVYVGLGRDGVRGARLAPARIDGVRPVPVSAAK